MAVFPHPAAIAAMASTFEQLVVFAVMSILVLLFTSIYVRDRRKEYRLWMLGWTAILVHFTIPLAAHWHGFPARLVTWSRLATVLLAGTCFLLSVSEIYKGRRRLIFVSSISFSALFYLTAVVYRPLPDWAYVAVLASSSAVATYQVFRHHGWRNPYGYVFVAIFFPAFIWGIAKVLNGQPVWGFYVCLSSVFIAAGVQYWRYFRRLSSGVLLTSISFVCWGMVFPLAGFLMSRHIAVPHSSVLWDLPKYFVAFGMIMTLFENQAEMATSMARQYEDLFEANLAAVYLSTFEGALLNCNSAFQQMYGFSSKEAALAARADEFYPEPAARDHFVAELRSSGQILNYECRQRKHDGTVFWILERARVIVEPNGRQIIEGTAIDITERKHAELALKHSEELFATIFRQSPVGCSLLSLDGIFLNVNDQLARVFGLPAREVVGKSGVDLGLWNSQRERNDFYRHLRADGSVRNLEVMFKDAAGNKHEGLYFATLVSIGERECILGMLLDQTEKRELEAKFLQAQKMESLGRLAGGVAHDFNNLLGVIGGYAELLEAKLGGNDGHGKYCRKILETTQRGSGLTRQLLTFSRKEFTRPTPLRTDQAISEVTSILPRLIGEDIELLVDLRSSATVVMDRTHLEQIILNLVVNARDAMPGGGRIFIETEDVFRPSISKSGSVDVEPFVALRIRDTGIGMDEEVLTHVFEPFYTTKETGRGTGLGLSTVYGIVQQAHGEISLHSQPGCGTQVNILLRAVAEPETLSPESSFVELKKGLGKILLVEDEIALRDANAEFLHSLGYNVICAATGPDALRIAHEDSEIDLVITDVVMPRMNGREFAEALLEFRPNLKVLFVSGYADDVVLQAGISIDGVPFLQKPFSLKQLGNKVQELLAAESRQLQ